MAIYFLNAGADAARSGIVEQRIRHSIPDLIRIASLQELGERAARAVNDSVYLLIFSPREPADFGKFAEIAAAWHGRLFFVLITDEISASDYKALVRGGSADWVSVSADPHEILDIVARHRRRIDAEQSGEGSTAKPIAVSFVPSAGGVGNTTLALETAVRLKTDKATRERRVCIVDLDFQGSHVCDYLDLEPRLKIQEILDHPERLDAQLFEIFISRHSSGLHVFAAPRTRLDLCGLNVSALDAFFNLASTRYDLMLIDLPPLWFPWTEQVVSASDGVIVTGLNTIPRLRQAVETVAAVRAAGKPGAFAPPAAAKPAQPPDEGTQIAVAINRCRRLFIGGMLNQNHVETVLSGEKVFYVGEEAMALESVNTGTPIGLSKGSGGFAKEIGALAAFCAGLKSSRAAQPATPAPVKPEPEIARGRPAYR
jgi:pilus assembly protein CpaE